MSRIFQWPVVDTGLLVEDYRLVELDGPLKGRFQLSRPSMPQALAIAA